MGRSRHPPQTPAAQFKRLYRNCPGRKSPAQSCLVCRGSPDRDLTFTSTEPIRSVREVGVSENFRGCRRCRRPSRRSWPGLRGRQSRQRFGKGRGGGGGLEQKKGAGRDPWLLRVYSCGGADGE